MGVKVMRLDEEAKIMTFALVDAGRSERSRGVGNVKTFTEKKRKNRTWMNLLALILFLISLTLIFKSSIRNFIIGWNTNKYQISKYQF